ncbi:hypothetical protein XENOCAPTIV_028714, partial [Xenoophorus captivus]
KMSLFKRFFKGIIHDRHPEDETPKYHGTVTPYPHFDASSDVSVLQSAIQSKGLWAEMFLFLSLAMKSVLRSDLEDVVLALLMPPAYFDAFLFRKATKILRLFFSLHIKYKIELEEVIKRETHGDFNKALLAMLSAKRDETTEVNMELAKKDAKVLFEAGEGVGKADVSTFISILTTRSGPQLSKSESQKCLNVPFVGFYVNLSPHLDKQVEQHSDR